MIFRQMHPSAEYSNANYRKLICILVIRRIGPSCSMNLCPLHLSQQQAGSYSAYLNRVFRRRNVIPILNGSLSMTTTLALIFWGIGAITNLTAVIFFRNKDVKIKSLFMQGTWSKFYRSPGHIIYRIGSVCIVLGFVLMYGSRF